MLTRRQFNTGLATGSAVSSARLTNAANYADLNVVLVRFGGGARRFETIDPEVARQLAESGLSEDARANVLMQPDELVAADHRSFAPDQSLAIQAIWRDRRRDFGDSGFKNPRGDRPVTALAIRALSSLRPQLMMLNYQDPDYVYWGNAS